MSFSRSSLQPPHLVPALVVWQRTLRSVILSLRIASSTAPRVTPRQGHITYSLDVLDNLEQFPIEADESLNEYYLKIAQIIDGYKKTPQNGFKYDRFYVQNIKPFFCNAVI